MAGRTDYGAELPKHDVVGKGAGKSSSSKQTLRNLRNLVYRAEKDREQS